MSRTPKRPRDTNQLAKMVVDLATGEAEDSVSGPLGGSPGGKRRAELLPKERKIEIARKGANARWSKNGKSNSTERA